MIQKDSEIAFLKDTIRIECEERMGLLTLVQQLKSRKIDIAEHAAFTPVETVKFTDDVKVLVKPRLLQKEKQLHALFLAARTKNEKRLLKRY